MSDFSPAFEIRLEKLQDSKDCFFYLLLPKSGLTWYPISFYIPLCDSSARLQFSLAEKTEKKLTAENPSLLFDNNRFGSDFRKNPIFQQFSASKSFDRHQVRLLDGFPTSLVRVKKEQKPQESEPKSQVVGHRQDRSPAMSKCEVKCKRFGWKTSKS